MNGTASARPMRPERQRIVGELVDLPGDHHGLDLGSHRHRQETGDEPAKVADAKRGVRIVGEWLAHAAAETNAAIAAPLTLRFAAGTGICPRSSRSPLMATRVSSCAA